MKFFFAFAVFVAIACFNAGVLGAALNEAKPAHSNNQQAAAGAQEDAENVESLRYRKSAYGGGSSGGYGGGSASIPAPPCPKNYLFSCQPSMIPVPCAAPQPSYGSQGAYSVPMPVIVKPIDQAIY